MANTNAISAVYNLPTQTINAGTETLLTGAVVSMPPNANVDGHSFRVRLIGKATGGATTLALKFRLGTLITGTNVALFQASGAATVPTTGTNFSVVADYTWDSVSGILNGIVGGQTAGTLTAAATTTAGTGITSAAGIQFVASAQFGAASASNTVSVEELTIEQL